MCNKLFLFKYSNQFALISVSDYYIFFLDLRMVVLRVFDVRSQNFSFISPQLPLVE